MAVSLRAPESLRAAKGRKGVEWEGLHLHYPALVLPRQYLREVAVGPGAAAEALLITQAVVHGRLHHVARVDLAGADVMFICQASEQVLGVAHKLRAREQRVRGPGQGSPCPQGSGYLSTLCLGCSLTLTRDRRGAWEKLRTG